MYLDLGGASLSFVAPLTAFSNELDIVEEEENGCSWTLPKNITTYTRVVALLRIEV